MLKLILLIIYISLLVSCREKLIIEGFDLQAWKDDKLGCKGVRDQLVPILLEQRDSIVGLSEAEILKALGRPDFQELSRRNQKFYYYHVLPGQQCEGGLSGETNQTLQIRFNSVGYTNEIIMNR
ncbi:MAG: hypothetical protein M3421_02060 [Bacteroidota bacterium]|nr:hypothetical protein [Bacteroidota bacterium]